MAARTFDHERLDVYRLSIVYVALSFETSQSLSGLHRHARDQWLRAAQSIPLNIAEGNGKRSLKDRARFLDIARGSALECAAIQAMLTRMAMKFDGVTESPAVYNAGVEHEHDKKQEPCGAPERRQRFYVATRSWVVAV
ncbi:MAG: four helix bundle protein [Novipirellula sp. JB048]